MQIFQTFLLVVQVISALAIIVLVLLQHGKGADMGAAFGSGSSSSLFGAAGSANVLSRATAICAATFFISTLGLAYAANHRSKAVPAGGVMSTVPAPTVPGGAAPAQSGTPPASVPANPPATQENKSTQEVPK
ncbi:MAG: preprotein translocase subunit SecG [Burkholderiaceae bacterium]|nr:preprotein translocase subunit SecG [Burkholderiaceae bacterium]